MVAVVRKMKKWGLVVLRKVEHSEEVRGLEQRGSEGEACIADMNSDGFGVCV